MSLHERSTPRRAATPETTPGVYTLSHPLGLRMLAALAEEGIDRGARVNAEVTVLHVLECQEHVERDLLARPTGPLLVLTLRGPLSFSSDELARLAPDVSVAQVEAAVRLLRGWSRRAPERLSWRAEGTFVGVTPWTTLTDLRRHLDALDRHELALDPLAGDGLPSRVADPAVAAVIRAALAVEPEARRQALRRALDGVVGTPRGDRSKLVRLIPAPRYDDRRPARTAHVSLTRAESRTPRQRAADAIQAVRRAAQAGATELVVGGGEPTLEWYLEDLVALARSVGFGRVVLETHAVEISITSARALAAAGLSRARVALDTFDEAASDSIVGVPGSLARTLKGARALLDAGVPVELAVALSPDHRGALARVVEEVSARLPPSAARVERVVARPLVGSSVVEAAREITEGIRAAARAGLVVEVDRGTAPPPCAYDDLEIVAPALHLSEESAADEAERVRVPLCEGCGAHHVCRGPLRAVAREVEAIGRCVAHDAPGIPPTRERERVLRELKSVLFQRGPAGEVKEHRVLRVNFHCNQACDFCFVSRELPPPEDALLLAELREVAARGASLAISGGEPTLNPRLPAYIATAVDLGIEGVQLQTNAIKMSDPAYTAELVAAGLRFAFVSLHGTTAATSDRVTAAPGTFVKTIAGIKNLIAAGVRVCLNFVLCAYNARDLAELPDFVARELSVIPGAQVDLNFSFVAAGSENVPRDTGLIPRFTDVAWALEAGLDRARALGLAFLGFDSQCGVPACFLPVAVREAWFVEDLPTAEVATFGDAFRKGDACASCDMSRRCYGLRAAYADTYGTGELRAIRR